MKHYNGRLAKELDTITGDNQENGTYNRQLKIPSKESKRKNYGKQHNFYGKQKKKIVLVRHSTTLLNFLVEWQMRIIWESEERK